MAFVDIFNFKKYITKPSDAATARIGHVNAVGERLSSPVKVTQQGVINSPVTIDGYSGVITLAGILETGSNITINVTNPKVKADSCVLITIDYASLTDAQDDVSYGLLSVSDGQFVIVMRALTSATSQPLKIHFLVIS